MTTVLQIIKNEIRRLENDIMTTHYVGKQIKLIRTHRGMSLGDIAERCKITKGAISKIENGIGNPTIATCTAIYKAMGYKLDFKMEEV